MFFILLIERLCVLSVGACLSDIGVPEFWMSKQCLHVTSPTEGCVTKGVATREQEDDGLS